MTRPIGRYRAESLGTRAHVALRWWTSPMTALAELVPTEGRILDWGCGHGVFAVVLADASHGRTVVGVDIDTDKLAVLERVAAAPALDGRVLVELASPRDRPSGAWDAIVILDVLYLLEPAEQQAVVTAAAAALAPGGVLVVKDMAERPVWKSLLSRAQEQVSVRLARITASADGTVPGSPPLADLRDWMADAGLRVELYRQDRGYHCPHVVLVGHAPPA